MTPAQRAALDTLRAVVARAGHGAPNTDRALLDAAERALLTLAAALEPEDG